MNTTRITVDSNTANKFHSDDAINLTLERFYAYSNEQKPLIISDEQRRELEALMQRNFNTSDELVKYIHRVYEVNVNGLAIEINPRLLERLKNRSLGMEFNKFVQMTIVRSLEEFAGLR